MLNGEMKHVDVEYRCQSCGHLYIDEERQWCEAPAVGQKLAVQRARAIKEAESKGEHLNEDDKKFLDAINTVTKATNGESESKQPLLLTDVQLKQAWFTLRNAWTDEKIKNKGVHELSLLNFLTKYLREANYPEAYIDKILQWQRDETARTNIP